ncbi:olfactory receptor 8S1 [Camelus ferus]|uniref:Olfactory receptor 8S1 n=1 Tax=Camelus ferus TaxID=419612 RepID=A0A8B6YCY6_CAMFR|nr:olfactory receptor 8S1 [Camelus ferus]
MSLIMKNLTIITEFVFMGLSRIPQIQTMLFALFLVMYLLTLMGNLMVILVIRTDYHLKTPMYFFLGHLSFLDLSLSSVTMPKMLQNLLTQKKTISTWACMTQSFFLMFSGTTESCLLSVMAYDRYAAICHPLLCSVVLNRPLCVGMVITAWGYLGKRWPKRIVLEEYKTPTDWSGALPGLRIISAILNIRSSEGQGKAFSTCSSHLTVVLLFYGTALFRYISPASGSALERVVSIQYSVITSLLNPLIYSLKNQEVKAALQRMLRQQTCATG